MPGKYRTPQPGRGTGIFIPAAEQRRRAALKDIKAIKRDANALQAMGIPMNIAQRQHNPDELKGVDTYVSKLDVDTDGDFKLLNGTKAGTGYHERIGNKITMKSIELRIQFEKNANVLASPQEDLYQRVLCVYDNQTNGVEPVWADVIRSIDITGTPSSTSTDFVNLANRNRFIILMDKTFVCPRQDQVTPTGNMDMTFWSLIDGEAPCQTHQFIKLKGLKTFYKASTGLISDITTGGLYIMTFGNQTDAKTGVDILVSSRLRYWDT